MSFHELCALYYRADVMLVTSLRDGMNLVSFEFIACQNKKVRVRVRLGLGLGLEDGMNLLSFELTARQNKTVDRTDSHAQIHSRDSQPRFRSHSLPAHTQATRRHLKLALT